MLFYIFSLSCDICKIKHHPCFKLTSYPIFNTQWIYNDAFLIIKFHKIKTAKSRCVLILCSTYNSHILTLNFKSKLSNFIFSKGQIQPLRKSLDDSNHQSRTSTQATAARHIRISMQRKAQRLMHKIPNNAIINSFENI